MKKVDRLRNLTILNSMPSKTTRSTSLDDDIDDLVNMIFISVLYSIIFYYSRKEVSIMELMM